MAFSCGNSNNVGAGGAAADGGVNVLAGPDLEDIVTEALGFLALGGDAKVQLLPSSWPSENLPPPTASLMSVASRKGLIAAAGPDAVILATTESVRKAFDESSAGDGNIKPFQPQLLLPMPTRISQLAFAADESYLVLSAEDGGGLAVYEVQALLNGSTQRAFELSTSGQALRALTPNPTADRGELLAIVTADGSLMIANLKERNFVSGVNGQVLKNSVSCISWSRLGKQLIAGLGNGTAFQMTPDGAGTGDIPQPPTLSDGHHVSSITWLEKDLFLIVHTPTNFDSGSAPPSTFHVVTRQQPSSFLFQKIPDPATPYGLNRYPPHHFLLRLRDFPPNIQDILIVASSASTDIGIFSRSNIPLTNEKSADKITGCFTMTEMADDSRRAQLPMARGGDTSPIGLALDLSSKEKVVRPIPSDEMNESPTPLPALLVLNNEGVLAAWWVIHSDSIRQGTTYTGLVSAEAASQSMQSSPALSQNPTPPFGTVSKPIFGSSTFGAQPNTGLARPTTAFGAPSVPVPSASNTFGGSTGVFGASSSLGQKVSPWGKPTTSVTAASSLPPFPSSTFGSGTSNSNTVSPFAANSTPAFGSSAQLGSRSSPWASAGPAAPTSSFGQPSALGTPGTGSLSIPPSTGTTAPSSVGFASFADKGGFTTAAVSNSTGSIFGTKPTASRFATHVMGSEMDTSTNIAGSSNAVFNMPGALFKPTNFVLGSTFKADASAKDDAAGPASDIKSSFFGSHFTNALGEGQELPLVEPSISRDADMDSTENVANSSEPIKLDPTAPASAPAPPRPHSLIPAPLPNGGLFGTNTTPSAFVSGLEIKPVMPAGFSFGKPATEEGEIRNISVDTLHRDATPTPKISTSGMAQEETATSETLLSPQVKQEPPTDEDAHGLTNEVPLTLVSPDPATKTSYGAVKPSISSTETDSPLHPDFISGAASEPKKTSTPTLTGGSAGTSIPSELIPPSDVPGGPEDERSDSDFVTESEVEDDSDGATEEGSGEDITKDISTSSDTNHALGLTPQSSFGGLNKSNPDSILVSKTPTLSRQHHPRSLFGEIGSSAPVLPPPKLQVSPRSPSPVRSILAGKMTRAESARSVSAPGIASVLLGSRRLSSRPPAPSQSMPSFSLEQQKAEEQRRVDIKARKEVEDMQALADDDDDMMQKYLSSELKGTRTLDEFQAHSDYIGQPSIDSIPSQVEIVYRDINSMIDTLGVNSRALKCFIKGHTEQYKEQGRTRMDLEDDEDWCLDEIEALLAVVEKDMTKELENGRVNDVANKLEICNDLQKDLMRLRAKHEDIKKILAFHSNLDNLAVGRAQPLSAEQAAQQHDLRRDFTKFQNLLSEAEEGLSNLKASAVAKATSSGRVNSAAGPTVEAVMRTISKMTTMAEKRSGDIDVLEGQMRKLRFSSSTSTASREASPFATPQNNRSSLRYPGLSTTYGAFHTPESIQDTPRGLQNSLMSSTSSRSRTSPSRKKMSGFTAEEKSLLRKKLGRRKEVADMLRAALQKAGTNIRLMDDDE